MIVMIMLCFSMLIAMTLKHFNLRIAKLKNAKLKKSTFMSLLQVIFQSARVAYTNLLRDMRDSSKLPI
jgi:hypothetical protein